jgi:release factor glutamine methyltransferase
MSVTIKDLLEEGWQQLRGAGIVNPRVAAESMLRYLLNLRRVDLYLKDASPVAPEDEAEFRRMIHRKLRREPLQYIIGETEWFGLAIKCSRAALAPRPETEIIVERALELIVDVPEPLIADIGVGTGCIAIAIAVSRPDARIVATDISADALSLARENVTFHGVEQQVALRLGNLFEPLETEPVFDLIISNPPYVSETEYQALMPEVRDFEPKLALVAGAEGLDVIRPLIETAHIYLKSGGLLIFEIGERQAEPARQEAAICHEYEILPTIIDYNDKDRGIVLRKR